MPDYCTETRVITPVANIYAAPQGQALQRQALFGAKVLCTPAQAGMAGIELPLNGYTGFCRSGDLGGWAAPTHAVRVRATFGFSAPDIKAPNPVPLSYGSQVVAACRGGKFIETVDGYFIPAAHLGEIDHLYTDYAAEAEKILNTSYLWGGNSAFGIDCSGMVQLALNAGGVFCPGDTGAQQAHFTGPAPRGYARNQLLFWKGHVALTLDDQRLIHANAHAMCVAVEGIEDAITRIADAGEGGVTHWAAL